MKQRSPLAATLLSIFIPFYILYWLVNTAKDIKQRGGNPPSLWLLFAPLVGLVAVFALAFVGGAAGGSVRTATNVLVLLGGMAGVILAIVLPFVYYYHFSVSAEAVTGGRVAKLTGFILFILLAPAAVYIIQNALNETAGGTIATANPVTPAPGPMPGTAGPLPPVPTAPVMPAPVTPPVPPTYTPPPSQPGPTNPIG